MRKPNKASLGRREQQSDLNRERQAVILLEKKGENTHRKAIRLWEEARRSASTGEIVTGWCGKVGA